MKPTLCPTTLEALKGAIALTLEEGQTPDHAELLDLLGELDPQGKRELWAYLAAEAPALVEGLKAAKAAIAAEVGA